jgi:hypothetical protein
MKSLQKGFSAVEAIVVILTVAALCSSGYFVWHAQHKNTGAPAATSNDSAKKVTQKTYSDKDYGFSFQYPDTWKLKTDLKDIGQGLPEGTVSVTAPSGTTVYFNPNSEGKHSSCQPDPSDRPDYTQNCSTLRILSSEKTAASSDEKPVYITQRRVTDSIENGGNSKYFVALTTIDESLKINTPIIDYDGGIFQDVTIQNSTTTGYVRAYISGGDTGATVGYGATKDYFTTKEVTEGSPILTSFKLL